MTNVKDHFPQKSGRSWSDSTNSFDDSGRFNKWFVLFDFGCSQMWQCEHKFFPKIGQKYGNKTNIWSYFHIFDRFREKKMCSHCHIRPISGKILKRICPKSVGFIFSPTLVYFQAKYLPFRAYFCIKVWQIWPKSVKN